MEVNLTDELEAASGQAEEPNSPTTAANESLPLTPTQVLARAITDDLIAQELILPVRREELLQKLDAGKITAADWRLLIELAIPKSQEESENATTNGMPHD